MDNIIILDETEFQSDIVQIEKTTKVDFKVNISSDSDLSESEYPCINVNSNQESQSKIENEKEWNVCDFPDINVGERSFCKQKNNAIENESQSDSDYETQNKNVHYWDEYIKGLQKKYLTVDNDQLSEDELILEKEVQYIKEKKKVAKFKATKDEEKRKRQEERIEKKKQKEEEALRQKAIKQLNSKNRLGAKQDYCITMMEIVLDNEIEKFDFFNDFLKTVEENNLTYNVQSRLIPKSITWSRRIEENYLNEKHEVCSKFQTVDQKQIMIVWNCQETIQHVFNDTLISSISYIKSLVPNKILTLVIYKISSYFKYLKTMKDQAIRNEILGEAEKKKKSKTDKDFSNYPKILKKKFEECLVEIQLLYKVNSRLIENDADIVLLIYQYTKSLAQLPSKMEKRQESSKLDWYADCDNRDTVKVDKDGNGLKRLWQQQLCQFTLMSLETAEAVASVYKTPLKLIEAYKNCTQFEGEMLLRDIPIRRAAGPLTSVRKIGAELSKKLYIMFTSEDGEISLNK